MNETTNCSAFIRRIQADHHQLNLALAHLKQLAAPGKNHIEFAKALESLRKELSEHFEEEAACGCFDEIVSRCPSLSGSVKLYTSEHAIILDSLDRLIANMTRTGRIDDQIREEFNNFESILKAHEVGENRLIVTALGGDAYDYDQEGL